MKVIGLIVILIFSITFSFSQEVKIYRNGKIITTKIVATSDLTIHTSNGNFQFNDIDSIALIDANDPYRSRFEEIATKYKFSENVRYFEPNFEKLINDDYIEGLPFTDLGELTFVEVVTNDLPVDHLEGLAKKFIYQFNDINHTKSTFICSKTVNRKTESFGSLFNDTYTIKYWTKIQCKEGRYRYELYDFQVIQDYSQREFNPSNIFLKKYNSGKRKKEYQVIQELIMKEMNRFAFNLKKAMDAKKLEVLEDSDW